MNFLHATEKKRVAIYIRVSTVEQDNSGFGLEAQEQRLISYIEQFKFQYTLDKAHIYRDTHSGAELMRPALQKMLADAKKKKFDAIMVWKIDRLSRSLKHLLSIFEVFEANDLSFVSIQENLDFKGPMGKLILQIFGAIAQFERDLIKGRTQAGIAASARMNNYVKSHPPYGYMKIRKPGAKGSTLEIIPGEAAIVKKVFKWYVINNWGYGTIADKLNKEGVTSNRTHRGQKKNKWTDKMIRTMLQTTEYFGQTYYTPNEEDPDDIIITVPKIVDEYLYKLAQETKAEKPSGKTKYDYLLSGKIKDMSLPDHITTNRSFVGAQRNKGGFSYRRKQFIEKDGTRHKSFEVPGAVIDEMVWNKIKQSLSNPEAFISDYIGKFKSRKIKLTSIEEQLAMVRQDIVKNEIMIEKVTDKNLDGLISDEDMKVRITRLNGQIGKLRQREQELGKELVFLGSIEVESSKLKEASAAFKEKVQTFNKPMKKKLVSLFIDRVEMYRSYNDPKKPDIHVEVIFRFNPEKLSQLGDVVSTKKQLSQRPREIQKGVSEGSGAARRI